MKILICDDEYVTRIMIRAYLEPFGAEIIEASGGREAEELAASAKPDLLIIDYSMPDMTGLELMERLGGSVPAVMLTSEGFSGDIERLIKEKASAYIIKPPDEDSLIRAVKEATGISLGH